jgi:hypothetical protein
VTIAVITGGRDRIPTLAELVEVIARLTKRGATTVRNGKCRGTDIAVAEFIRARTGLLVEDWPAEDFGAWPSCGPKRNRGMLDGDWRGEQLELTLSGHRFVKPPANFLVALKGGVGTRDCCSAALGERWLPIEWIPDVEEPRIWNSHHGSPPHEHGEPAPPLLVIARPEPLGNPWPLELRDGETRAAAAGPALMQYKKWLWSRIKPGGRNFDRRVRAALESITAEHYLACTCWPRHCHGEVVLEAWRGLHGLLGPKIAVAMGGHVRE